MMITAPVGFPVDVDQSTVPYDITIDGDLHVTGSVQIDGNEHVSGQSTFVDNMLVLNTPNAGAGVAAGEAGISIDRGTLEDTSIVWDEATDAWMIKYDTTADQSICVRSSTITAGRIPFGNSIIGYTEDAGLNWDNSTKRLGIGTAAPGSSLHVLNATEATVYVQRASGATALLQAQETLVNLGTGTNHELRIQTNATDRGVIGNGGSWGIGTVAPGATTETGLSSAISNPELHVHNGAGLVLVNSGTSVVEYFVDTNAAANAKALKATVSNQVMSFEGLNDDLTSKKANVLVIDGANGRVGVNTASPSVDLDVTGTAKVSSLLDISGAGAGQIKFPASQNASADANTLDDYEEGTFTPQMNFSSQSGSFTYTSQSGKYTKIGRTVKIEVILSWTAIPSGGTGLYINGLPFTIASNGSCGTPYSSGVTGSWSTSSPHGLLMSGGNTYMVPFRSTTTNSVSYNFGDIPSAGNLIFTASYDV